MSFLVIVIISACPFVCTLHSYTFSPQSLEEYSSTHPLTNKWDILLHPFPVALLSSINWDTLLHRCCFFRSNIMFISDRIVLCLHHLSSLSCIVNINYCIVVCWWAPRIQWVLKFRHVTTICCQRLKRKKEKELRKFHATSNTVIRKIDYATIFSSFYFSRFGLV